MYSSQILANIKIKNIVKTKDNIQIKIENKIKTLGPRRFQPLLILPVFKKNLSLCIASVINRYLLVTETLRGHKESLFINKKTLCKCESTDIRKMDKERITEKWY